MIGNNFQEIIFMIYLKGFIYLILTGYGSIPMEADSAGFTALHKVSIWHVWYNP
jgi:hypothetical protein